jgi:hypothetical protein
MRSNTCEVLPPGSTQRSRREATNVRQVGSHQCGRAIAPAPFQQTIGTPESTLGLVLHASDARTHGRQHLWPDLGRTTKSMSIDAIARSKPSPRMTASTLRSVSIFMGVSSRVPRGCSTGQSAATACRSPRAGCPGGGSHSRRASTWRTRLQSANRHLFHAADP